MVAIEVVGLKPNGVDMSLSDNLCEQLESILVELHSRAGVDDVQHSIAARNLLQHSTIDLVGVGTHIAIVVAEGAATPAASAPLQEQKFAWKLAIDK